MTPKRLRQTVGWTAMGDRYNRARSRPTKGRANDSPTAVQREETLSVRYPAGLRRRRVRRGTCRRSSAASSRKGRKLARDRVVHLGEPALRAERGSEWGTRVQEVFLANGCAAPHVGPFLVRRLVGAFPLGADRP